MGPDHLVANIDIPKSTIKNFREIDFEEKKIPTQCTIDCTKKLKTF